MTFEYVAPARTPRAVLVLVGFWAVLVAGWVVLDVEGWIAAGLGLFTLPLLWELLTGKVAHLTLDETQIRWQSGRLTDAVNLSDIDHVRLDRRLDGSMRVTLVLGDGQKVRLQQDCVPPTATFEAALQSVGVRAQRHPFSLF